MKKAGKDRTKRISKFLSLVLRHKPQHIDLELDKQGWANVNSLIGKAAKNARVVFSRDILEQVVANNDKKRFSFSEDGKSIRANQGHSIEIELGYETSIPPAILYHGTHPKAMNDIMRDGLKKMDRHHVHLSKDTATAEKVGARRGKPILLQVDTKTMHEDGHLFYVSTNGVWLTDHVPPKYLIKLEG